MYLVRAANGGNAPVIRARIKFRCRFDIFCGMWEALLLLKMI